MKDVLDYVREGRGYIAVAVLLVVITLWLLLYVGSPVGGDDRAVMVVIPKGATARQIADALARQRLIRSSWSFVLIVRATGVGRDLKPGAYLLNRRMSLRAVIHKITEGRVDAVKVTIPEGFTVWQIADKLAENGLVDRARFLELVTHGGRSFVAESPAGTERLEGYLFPSTYLIPVRASPREIVTQMLDTFRNQVIPELAANTDRLSVDGKPVSVHQVVTVASLVEREAKKPADRPLVSAVIWNRLARGMRLQVDATVLYAMGEHRPRLYYRDLGIDSPYNTYTHVGLPPGPIANPGLASIRAALHPARVDYLYYVARPDGSHIFSRTLEEHNSAKTRVRAAGAAGGSEGGGR